MRLNPMRSKQPSNGAVEGEYADGYVHSETKLNDISPWEPTRNILNDLLEHRPEAEHGRMVRFSVFHGNKRHDFDWTKLPENARPIRFRDMERDIVIMADGTEKPGEVRIMKVRFGYQYTDAQGQNQQHVEELN